MKIQNCKKERNQTGVTSYPFHDITESDMNGLLNREDKLMR